jgi:hypothetical protein
MESEKLPQQPNLDPRHPTPKRADAKRLAPANHSGSSSTERGGKAYIPLPVEQKFQSTGDASKEKTAKTRKRARWLILAIAAIAIVGGSFAILNKSSHPQQIVLSVSDIDEQATEAARTALNSGQIPALLANFSPGGREKIKNGEVALSKPQQVLPERSQGISVRVLVTSDGQMLGVDMLTSERPVGTVFPISRNRPTDFHFIVEQAGPAGTVVCSVIHRASTAPLAQGQQADLEVIEK